MNISVIAQTLLFLISCVSKVSSQGICPEKWSILGGRCYRFFRYHDPLFGGYREHSCYAGRRFLPHAATCVKDATCVFGAPSHNISAKAYALKQKVNQLRKNPDLLHVKKNVTLYMGITAFMMVVMATLVVAVVRLYVRGQKAVCGSRKTSQNSLTDTGSILTQQV